MRYIIIFSVCLVLLSSCKNKEKDSNFLQMENENNVVFNGRTYGIIDYNGTKWLDRNLGAKEACDKLEGNEWCWGDLYQWGRYADGHEKRDSSVTLEPQAQCSEISNDKFILTKIEGDISKNVKKMSTQNWYKNCNQLLWRELGDGANEVCPAGWHVATEKDFDRLQIQDGKDAFRKIKLCLAGSRSGIERYDLHGKVMAQGLQGKYWTSTHQDRRYTGKQYIVSYDLDSFRFIKTDTRSFANGQSVRCVKNE